MLLAFVATAGAATVESKQGTIAPVGRNQAGDRVLWTARAPQGLSNIFWTHIPKTSTTWARTLFAYACGANADRFHDIGTTQTVSPLHGACTPRLSRQQDELINNTDGRSNVTWFHMSVPWSTGASAMPLVRAVTLLRSPPTRLHSEYRMLASAEGFICCSHTDQVASILNLIPGQNWGWDRRTRGAAVAVAHGRHALLDREDFVDVRIRGPDPNLHTNASRVRAFREVLIEQNALYGCQTKMLLGYGCHESHELTSHEIQRARDYVRSSELAFVGLSERYNDSVCLFHVLHGGPLWDFEAHLPAHEATSYMNPEEVASAVLTNPEDEALRVDFAATVMDEFGTGDGSTAEDFNGGTLDPDVEIYELATQRFDATIARRRSEMDACLATL